MTWKRLSLMLLLTVAIGVTACSQVTGRSAGTTVDDMTITAEVKTKLAAEQIGTLTRIDVDTVRATVYLNGNVQNPTLKSRASDIAQNVEGVREVVNNLQVAAAAR